MGASARPRSPTNTRGASGGPTRRSSGWTHGRGWKAASRCCSGSCPRGRAGKALRARGLKAALPA
jgi:hypothetical protein